MVRAGCYLCCGEGCSVTCVVVRAGCYLCCGEGCSVTCVVVRAVVLPVLR